MTVSVIVPLYNKADVVLRSLDSIAGQTFRDFEVIVVDDGSTDGSHERAAKHVDPRFRIVRQTNAGPGAARNRGVREALGELMAFLDADDTWLPEYLETAVSYLRQNPDVAVFSSGYIETPPGLFREEMWRRRGVRPGVQRITPMTAASVLSHLIAFMWPCSMVARAGVVRRWRGFYDKNRCRYGEDAVLSLKLLLNERVYFHFQPLAHFHREDSVLSGNFEKSRPADPMLLDPDEVLTVCPPELREAVRGLLAFRACKAACNFGYFGDWRQASHVVAKFVRLTDWKLPYLLPALVASTPLGRLLGQPALAVLQALDARGAFAHIRPGRRTSGALGPTV